MEPITDEDKQSTKKGKIILFGSLVSGFIDKGSDIDMIIIKETTKDPWTRASEVDRFIDHKLPVDVLVYTPAEIENRLKMNISIIHPSSILHIIPWLRKSKPEKLWI